LVHARPMSGLFGAFAPERLEHPHDPHPAPSQMKEGFLAKLKASELTTSFYPKGAILFEDGQKSRGFYVMLEGRAKVFMNAAHGKSLILGFFGPGATLGLAAAILGREQVSTAEIVRPAKVAFVSRTTLLEHLRSDAMAALDVAGLMSDACYFALRRMRTLDLCRSAQQRLARFLIELRADAFQAASSVKLDVSQETLAQMLGLSRETVARLIADLKRQGILDWKRSEMTIKNRSALEALAGWPDSGATTKRQPPRPVPFERRRA
jgi:CRP-like cAMP-binding protein